MSGTDHTPPSPSPASGSGGRQGAARGLAGLWREQPRLRWFFAAHLQGSLGAGAGYIALLLVAYERIGSAWAATAVLLADLLPSMLLGPLLGGLVDRTSRLGCAIAADLVRAGAFAGLIFAGGTASMIALALAAGLGNALFRPATSALLPALVPDRRLPAANALYGAMRDGGQLLGPACAAAMLLVTGAEAVLALSAATFAISAGLLTRLRSHVRATEGAGRRAGEPGGSLLAETGAGLRVVLAQPVVGTLIATSGAVVLAAGMMNVAELVLAQQELHAGGAGFALLACAYGAGMIAGSLVGARDGGECALRRRYLISLALLALGLLASATATALAAAMLSFALTGAGNGLFVVSDRVLLQRLVPERFHGRAFGLLDSIDSWGFAGALLAGGALASTAGAHATFAVAGAGALLVLLVAARALSPISNPGRSRHGLEVVTATQ